MNNAGQYLCKSMSFWRDPPCCCGGLGSVRSMLQPRAFAAVYRHEHNMVLTLASFLFPHLSHVVCNTMHPQLHGEADHGIGQDDVSDDAGTFKRDGC